LGWRKNSLPLQTETFRPGIVVDHYIWSLLLEMERLLDLRESEPLETDRFVIDVPYSSQHEIDAQKYRLDCGPACVEMVGEFWRGQTDGVGTDSIHGFITGGVDRGTTVDDLQKAALHFYNVKLRRLLSPTVGSILECVDDGNPVIVLVQYGKNPVRMDRNYTAGHWMVVIGFDLFDWAGTPIQQIIVHDPDFYGTFKDQGARIPFSRTTFEQMFWDVALEAVPNAV